MTEEIKQEQGKPVAWLIDDKSINHLQIKTIQRLIERSNHAHMTDIKLRINGQDEWYEGDWIKHMVEAPQPKQEQGEPAGKFAKFTDDIWREVTDGSAGVPLYTYPKKWVRLTNKEQSEIYNINYNKYAVHLDFADFLIIYTAIDAKLKEKNNIGENNLS